MNNFIPDVIKQEIKQAKVNFAKQGMFNTRSEFDILEYTQQLPRAQKWKGFWNLYPASVDDHNMWNMKWVEPQYTSHTNGKVKTLFFGDSNIAYKAHCVQRIFERNGFDPVNLPKRLDITDWIRYAGESIVNGVEQRFPIPFLDGLLIVNRRLGYGGTMIKCHSKGVKSINDQLNQPVYVAWTYIEHLNNAQNQTLFYINNGQFEQAKSKYSEWIKNYENENIKNFDQKDLTIVDKIVY